jgi:hypothetical protein
VAETNRIAEATFDFAAISFAETTRVLMITAPAGKPTVDAMFITPTEVDAQHGSEAGAGSGSQQTGSGSQQTGSGSQQTGSGSQQTGSSLQQPNSFFKKPPASAVGAVIELTTKPIAKHKNRIRILF